MRLVQACVLRLFCGLTPDCDWIKADPSKRFDGYRRARHAEIDPVVTLRLSNFTEDGEIEAELTNTSDEV